MKLLIDANLGTAFWLLPQLIFAIVVSNCSSSTVGELTGTKKEEVVEATPPTFVPFESISFGLGTFPEGTYRRGSTITAHVKAFLSVTEAQLILEHHLAAAVESLRAATVLTPTKTDGEDVWSYEHSFSYETEDYTGTLVSTKTTDGATWAASLSKASLDDFLCCTDFAWYTGETSSLAEGSWTIHDFKNSAEVEDLAFVNWTVNASDDKKLEFFVKKVDPAYSEWQLESSIVLTIVGKNNTLVMKKDPTADAVLTVKWHSKDLNGSITDENDDEECWDSDQKSVACP